MTHKEQELLWSVVVYLDGKKLVSISWNELAGLENLSERQEESIRRAGENLLGFVGRRKKKEQS